MIKKGDRLLLVSIDDDIYKNYNGKEAVVDHVDDAGQIHCTVDGGHVAVCADYGDVFKKL